MLTFQYFLHNPHGCQTWNVIRGPPNLATIVVTTDLAVIFHFPPAASVQPQAEIVLAMENC